MQALRTNAHVARVKTLYSQYEKYLPAGFFIGGFLFDIITLDRIDSKFTIIQQAVYLFLLALMLLQMHMEFSLQRPPGDKFRLYTNWRLPIMHFIFGSLLSSYTLFFFKSGSLGSSFLFLLAMAALLVANELPRFHTMGLGFKFALLALSNMCYFAYLIPTVIGQTGVVVFLVSILAGLVPSMILYRLTVRWGASEAGSRVQILRPALLVFLTFLIFYFVRIIPPVPLSLQHIGIYHTVKKTQDGKFELGHERPWWRFWQNGDQWFQAQPGDKIIAFFRLFSPSGFTDQVQIAWYLKDPRHGWTAQDRIPIKIMGGRDQGFRGYAVKSNFTVGEWRVVVETMDEREIGRLGFTIEVVPAQPREFKLERH
jgi:hypothetical protein